MAVGAESAPVKAQPIRSQLHVGCCRGRGLDASGQSRPMLVEPARLFSLGTHIQRQGNSYAQIQPKRQRRNYLNPVACLPTKATLILSTLVSIT
jgi:hypothetical protein